MWGRKGKEPTKKYDEGKRKFYVIFAVIRIYSNSHYQTMLLNRMREFHDFSNAMWIWNKKKIEIYGIHFNCPTWNLSFYCAKFTAFWFPCLNRFLLTSSTWRIANWYKKRMKIDVREGCFPSAQFLGPSTRSRYNFIYRNLFFAKKAHDGERAKIIWRDVNKE